MKAIARNIRDSNLLAVIDPVYGAIGISDFISFFKSEKLAAG